MAHWVVIALAIVGIGFVILIAVIAIAAIGESTMRRIEADRRAGTLAPPAPGVSANRRGAFRVGEQGPELTP